MSRPALSGWWDSPYTGLFRGWRPLPAWPHDPAVSVWSGLLPRWGLDGSDLSVGGVGLDETEAATAALGEAIERWMCRPLPGDGRVLATYADWPLDEPAVEPSRWVLFHPEQYATTGCPFRPLTATTPCHWICCRDAATGEPAWVPEAFVFLQPPRGSEPPAGWDLTPSLSTGLSAGRGEHPTRLRGLQEVVERDALVGMWWGRYPLEEHDPPPLGEEVLRRLLRPNLTYRWYRVGTPYAAHVTVVRLDGEDLDGPCFSVGSACRETRLASWAKAALEAVQGRSYVRYLRRQKPTPGMLGSLPVDFAGHAIYYTLHPGHLARTPFACPVSGDDDSSVETLPMLLERINRQVLVRVVTPPVGDGWRVLRVLVPGMQPLHGHHGFPFLGGPLWSPRGMREYLDTPPHPFP
jgi:thiazole/oxazole-forming peptide maturase SagD family component